MMLGQRKKWGQEKERRNTKEEKDDVLKLSAVQHIRGMRRTGSCRKTRHWAAEWQEKFLAQHTLSQHHGQGITQMMSNLRACCGLWGMTKQILLWVAAIWRPAGGGGTKITQEPDGSS